MTGRWGGAEKQPEPPSERVGALTQRGSDAGLKKTSYRGLSASAFHLSDFINSLGYLAISPASGVFKPECLNIAGIGAL